MIGIGVESTAEPKDFVLGESARVVFLDQHIADERPELLGAVGTVHQFWYGAWTNIELRFGPDDDRGTLFRFYCLEPVR